LKLKIRLKEGTENISLFDLYKSERRKEQQMRLTTSNKDVICSFLEPNSKLYRSQSSNIPPTSMWAHVKALTPT
jgi:hypothetical protein